MYVWTYCDAIRPATAKILVAVEQLTRSIICSFSRSEQKQAMAGLVTKTTELVKLGVTRAKPVLHVWQQYAKVELTPPTLKDIPAIRSGFSNLIHSARTGRYRDFTVREAVVNTLVAAEIYCWFYVGECIGKRHIVGYDV